MNDLSLISEIPGQNHTWSCQAMSDRKIENTIDLVIRLFLTITSPIFPRKQKETCFNHVPFPIFHKWHSVIDRFCILKPHGDPRQCKHSSRAENAPAPACGPIPRWCNCAVIWEKRDSYGILQWILMLGFLIYTQQTINDNFIMKTFIPDTWDLFWH